jgi:hypothetical protein
MKSTIKHLTYTPDHDLENDYKTDRATLLLGYEDESDAKPRVEQLSGAYKALSAARKA